MRLEIRLEPVEVGTLPPNYREALQAVIYRNLPSPLADALHDGRYWEGRRPVKPFVFSQLSGSITYQRADGFSVGGPVWFRFASPAADLVQALAEGLLRNGATQIATLRFAVQEVAALSDPPLKPPLVVRTLSPITVYRTVEQDGRRRTQYYNPLAREFAELVSANLARKAEILRLPCSEPIQIRPLGIGPRNRRLEQYKGTWIEAWAGSFRLEGPEPMLWLALHAGLGAKNSQGFGFVDVEPQRESRHTHEEKQR
ncbi:CRISPR-associated endoribonuclease Cas6 [Thermomicrobiaceae bacterium CFH 74404]|uniref:CRISPR-associated endoribonuclease n=1 Tax=Thermalbibacter longus TaxID=2951981 RepID=A0AA41WAQ0_9BACT|nr:CRISPR-associated endoribonuclease Cas6 [Thermalbibacter longus]MCM8747877.1 CRISPR-associated endoribonuclease Cas6 [Thermalbibacter longus]